MLGRALGAVGSAGGELLHLPGGAVAAEEQGDDRVEEAGAADEGEARGDEAAALAAAAAGAAGGVAVEASVDAMGEVGERGGRGCKVEELLQFLLAEQMGLLIERGGALAELVRLDPEEVVWLVPLLQGLARLHEPVLVLLVLGPEVGVVGGVVAGVGVGRGQVDQGLHGGGAQVAGVDEVLDVNAGGDSCEGTHRHDGAGREEGQLGIGRDVLDGPRVLPLALRGRCRCHKASQAQGTGKQGSS